MSVSDHEYVNFSEDYELDYHLELVNRSKSNFNRSYLRNNTRIKAKRELNKTMITHGEFKPFVDADKKHLES